ncbi:hypothetical protein ACTJJ0_21410 [Chitinophaga sp. 22321]|uniref:DUF4306 domain-containing protein n=1 Tax=Chitinophaga hostae TaxID=2831022 RepID=A0ABS5J4A2_9BACT|nr:hypothetical protein [Chitinophaga hostae]MBS0030046.1 hypothetical protein [Chitinophaga hostae]
MLKKNFTFTWLILSVIVCCVVTGISYHDGMAYDGATVMGFPFQFYNQHAGFNINSQSMQTNTRFKWLLLVADMLLIFVFTYIILRLLQYFRK